MASSNYAAEELANEDAALLVQTKALARNKSVTAARHRAELEINLTACRQKINKLNTPAQGVNILTKLWSMLMKLYAKPRLRLLLLKVKSKPQYPPWMLLRLPSQWATRATKD